LLGENVIRSLGVGGAVFAPLSTKLSNLVNIIYSLKINKFKEGIMHKCVDLFSPKVPCCICGKTVKTCELKVPVEIFGGEDFTCPIHDGSELNDGRWVCSSECWDKAVGED
jgi:hypothetical protein